MSSYGGEYPTCGPTNTPELHRHLSLQHGVRSSSAEPRVLNKGTACSLSSPAVGLLFIRLDRRNPFVFRIVIEMSGSLKAPEPFSFASRDLAANWSIWRRQFEWYIVAIRNAPNVDEEMVVGVLLTLLGTEGLKIYDTFVFVPDNHARQIIPVLDKFTAHFEPRRCEVYERFKFLRRHQRPDETLDAWLIELRNLVKTCNYGPNVDSFLRDVIVLGIADPLVREKLLYENDLQLAKACDIVRACEHSKAQLTQFSSPAVDTAHALQTRPPARRSDNKSSQQPAGPAHEGRPPTEQHSSASGSAPSTQQYFQCNNCGRRHKKNQCRAAKIQCYNCGATGHYSYRCPSGNGQRQQSSQHSTQPAAGARVHAVGGDTQWVGDVENGGTAMVFPRSIDEDYFVAHEIQSTSGGSEWFQQLSVDGVSVNFKLDSGATCNILPNESFLHLPSRHRRLRPGPSVRSYGAKDGFLRVLGLHTAKVIHKGDVFIVDFVVVDEPGQPPILGLPSCEKMNLIRRIDAVQSTAVPQLPPIVGEFMDVFTGLGKLPIEHDIRLLTGANRIDPVVCAASRLPFRLEERVFKKLEEMVADGIITPVKEPTEWVSRMMVVGKPDGDVRICMDPSELNKAIQRQHFAVPTVEQLFSKISKARYFCSLDAASGFYQIPLSNAASYLCTMATPKGRYRYLRLPFGLKSAPEVYLQAMEDLFGDIPGVFIYFDDFLVTGDTMEELLFNLRQVFMRCRQHNLKLQLKKCRFFLQELPWLGHVIGQGVLKPDPNKIEAIVDMPDPSCPADLVRLLGMVTYLDKFCKDLAALTRPLRDLLKTDAAWIWEEPQKAVLSKLKCALSSLPVLRLFDHSLPVTVSVDASPVGIGAVLLQNGQPVAYSSTSLTATQKRYFQIEKELLAVHFGLLRFRQYVYGQSVVVETDHKPLVGLLDKPIASCTPRIQRLRLQLQRFDFKLVYKPGKELFIADTLSRAPSPRLFQDDLTQGCEEQVHATLDRIIPQVTTRSKFAEATAADPTLLLVKELLIRGWPEHKSQCPVAAKPFWSVRHNLADADGLLLSGERLVVPVSLRREVMDGIHDGHFGEVKCVLRARSAVYWPGCDDQIRNMVASCPTYQEHRHRDPAQPLRPVELPIHAFQRVSADLFVFDGVNYLLVVDAYSKWPAAVPLRTLSSFSTISEMERIFSDFGTPEVVLSDNGSQFDCAEFRAFCARRNIRSVTSSPTYAQSNGLVERHIQTVKQTLLKMFRDGRSLWESLAAIRSTPVSADLPSPAVLLQGRHLRGSLPFLPKSLTPQLVSAEFVRGQLQRRQAAASFHHGGRSDIRGSALIVGQRVRAHISGSWLPGAIRSVCSEPDSYVIRLLDGRVFRRTRRDINIDNSATAGFGVPTPPAPRLALPTLALPPPLPPAARLIRLTAQHGPLPRHGAPAAVPPAHPARLLPPVLPPAVGLPLADDVPPAPRLPGRPPGSVAARRAAVPTDLSGPAPVPAEAGGRLTGSTRSGRPYLIAVAQPPVDPAQQPVMAAATASPVGSTRSGRPYLKP